MLPAHRSRVPGARKQRTLAVAFRKVAVASEAGAACFFLMMIDDKRQVIALFLYTIMVVVLALLYARYF